MTSDQQVQERPCNHNMWEKVRKVSKAKVCLRCKSCSAFWYTRLELHTKCSLFYKGKCTKGGECEHPHIMTRGSNGKGSLKNELHNVRSNKSCMVTTSSQSDSCSDVHSSCGSEATSDSASSLLTYRYDPYCFHGYTIVSGY